MKPKTASSALRRRIVMDAYSDIVFFHGDLTDAETKALYWLMKKKFEKMGKLVKQH